MTGSAPCQALGDVCIVFIFCIRVKIERCFLFAVSVLFHLFEDIYQWFVVCNYFDFMSKTAMIKFFWSMSYAKYLSLNDAVSGFYTRHTFAG